jgi:hypothetical protein
MRLRTAAMSPRRAANSNLARPPLENMVKSFMGTTAVPLTAAHRSTTASCASAMSAIQLTSRSRSSSRPAPYSDNGTSAATAHSRGLISRSSGVVADGSPGGVRDIDGFRARSIRQ